MPSATEISKDNEPKWGDLAEVEESPQVEGPDENGIKTVTEYKINDKGQRVKVVKKIRVYKQFIKKNPKVEARKNWKKFGDCAGLPLGPESGITSIGDEVFLNLGWAQKSAEKKPEKDSIPLNIVCRTCGKAGDHWTLKCPFKELADKMNPNNTGDQPSEGDQQQGKSDVPGKYVIPARTAGASSAMTAGDDYKGRRDEGATVRVTNLSEDTKEADLQELFRPFGPISRIYLAKDKISNLSRGFAFINFVHRDDAAKAIDKLCGFGYDHLILHLEWAKPSK